MAKNQHRRWYGLCLGLAVGLAYGLLSQGINHLLLLGIPLYHPVWGFWGNVALAASIGMVLGLVTAWHWGSAWGVTWGSVAGAALMSGVSLWGDSADSQAVGVRVLMLALIFLPVAGACGLVLAIFRYIVDREMYAWSDTPFWSRERAILPILAIGLAGVIGSFSAYPPMGRAVTIRMHEMIQAGRLAGSREELPGPLQGKEVMNFMEKSHVPYRLSWESDASNRYRIARPLTKPYEPSTVVARFDSGWMLVCVFPNAAADPVCKDF